jgi:hypothetical protein
MMDRPPSAHMRFSSARLGSARGPLRPVFPNPTITSLAKSPCHAAAPFHAFQIAFKGPQTGGNRTTTQPTATSDRPTAPKSP